MSSKTLYFPLANVVLVISSFMSLMKYCRTYEQFSKLSQLIFQTFYSIRYFIAFFVIWIASFALVFQILGAEISNPEDYKREPNLMYYI